RGGAEGAAVLLGWSGGREFGPALADVLLGGAEPTGRLPTTWPAGEADPPVSVTDPVDGKLAYAEGIHLGYRAWLRAGSDPAYPFGHGLGYTTWQLGDLQLPDRVSAGDPVLVAVSLCNTGQRA